MSDIYDWKNLSATIGSGATTFGVIVPAMMHMELKEISYSNRVNANNRATIRQIPSGTVRPSSAIIIDDQQIAPNSPYSPRIPIRTVQEGHVLEGNTTQGEMQVNLAYRLRYGRP